MTETPPKRIDRYDIEGVIGRGAMGVILRAHDPVLDRSLAIKLIARELLDGADGADYTHRFQREARAASRCPHPNIVAIHDFGLFEGQPFLVMEFVDGISLQAALAAGRAFDVAQTVHIVGQVLDALACAHTAGIVHRDIKPANILISPDLRTRLADFGIARVDGSDLTRAGDMIGTPAYMSPEQCLGAAVDGRSDLFSLGSVLFEMLTRQRAFGGGGMAEVIRRVVDGAPAPLPDTLAAAQPGLAAVLARALQKDPAARFQSAAEMARALRAPSPDATVVTAGGRSFSGSPTSASAETLETVRQALLPFTGPIAGLLVKRAAAAGGDVWQRVATHIEDPVERRLVLAKQGTEALLFL